MLRPVIRISQNWPLRRARESAGPASRVPALVRLRQAVQPLAERMAHPPPHPESDGGAWCWLEGPLGGPACDEGAGVGSGTRVWGPRDQEDRRRRPGNRVPGVWDGGGEPKPGLRELRMETQVWDWVQEME